MYRDVYSCPRGVRPLWARRVGLTNRKRRKSNWRNTISRRQWSSRRIIARARARASIRDRLYFPKITLKSASTHSSLDPIRHSQRIRRIARIVLTIILSSGRPRDDAKPSDKL